jgi:histidinol-phosphate/aromatic aminotransferase/cobyric acid decarboxylase-like protein
MIKLNVQRLNRPHWSGLVDRVEKIEAGYTNLDRNENQDNILAEHISNAVKHFIDLDSVMKYEDYYRYYELFANYYNTSMHNLLITGGCDEAIRLTFEACLNPGHTFLTIGPTYRGSITNAADLCNNIVTTTEDEQDILAALQKTYPSVFYICTPNNPTGKVFSSEFIDHICRTYPNTMVFVDNTYRHFCDEQYLQLTEHKNCVIGFSYSKSWGLAGARLGILQGHRETIEHISKIRPIMSVSSITLKLAEYLHNNHYIIDKSIQRNLEGIKYAHKYFSNCNIYSEPTINHVVFDPTEEIVQQLDSKRILYGRATEFSPDAIRLTTLPVDQFEALICSNTCK